MGRSVSFRNMSIAVIVLWMTAFVFVPNCLVVIISFLTRDASRFVSAVFTPDNYLSLLEPVYAAMLAKTLVYSLVTTSVCLGVGYPFAWLISRSSHRVRPMLLIMVIIPFWTSSLIRTYALVILLKANGLVNTLLLAAGIVDKPLQLLYSDLAVYIGLTYTLLPFMILPLYANLEKIDQALIEAAIDLGAGTLQVFARIIIPLSLPGIVAGCTMVFLPAMGLFYIPDLLGGAKSMLIGNFIKNQFLTTGDWPSGSAASVFLTLIMLVMIGVYFGVMRRSAVKSQEETL